MNTTARPRRALIVAAHWTAATLQQGLNNAGYQTRASSFEDASYAVAEFAPDVVLVELHNRNGESAGLALARRLRAAPATHVLPILFLHHQDDRSLRSAALNVGADDYFPLTTPISEICARLDALFWRAEVGRRAAPVVGEQRAEIDNFLLLLDYVNEDINASTGTVALIVAVLPGDEGGREAHDRALIEAHGFFKLNLRRIDAVAFYGPTMLLVYLPRMQASTAQAAFTRLRSEFLEAHAGNDVAIGFASFPADSKDVESLIDKAEAAISVARSASSSTRVVGYHPGLTEPGATATTHAQTHTPAGTSQGAAVVERSGTDAGGAQPSHKTTTPDMASRQAGTSGSLTAQSVAEAAAQEKERRARGEIMPRRLLLAISDPARMTQVNSLVRAAGYEVRAAFDGQHALSLLRIERPDLLVLDYEIQNPDSLELLRLLRKQSGGRLPVPVLTMLTPRHDQSRRELLETGVRGVVDVPYDPSRFLELVRTTGNTE